MEMEQQEKSEFSQLTAGYEFSPQSYKLDYSTIFNYLEAVRESDDLYCREGFVPPMAVGAFAMSALSSAMAFPPGTVHVSQEFTFKSLVRVGDTITCLSKVSRNHERGGMHLMATDLTVLNQNQEQVLTGRVGFVLPKLGESGGLK
jgi:hypothetical protein